LNIPILLLAAVIKPFFCIPFAVWFFLQWRWSAAQEEFTSSLVRRLHISFLHWPQMQREEQRSVSQGSKAKIPAKKVKVIGEVTSKHFFPKK
jgi:hypothetical protein